ncbi:family 5 extracellular solute-binding protein [Neobacillus bataviensis LMG 21833]|uniref:Glutathione-binding protein GsiB n=1 Tax=Neobacillus bataviensis LMG 21833 TaxID=1117379 RepID=K6CKH6_9BACI|nr:glutathione ABC transporter substrate-binding protein [Neobacillus bataviensis]EKN71655.1 family 5 extracellular solute-binding protein [Neobacillus bataviensis LMG 21833]
MSLKRVQILLAVLLVFSVVLAGCQSNNASSKNPKDSTEKVAKKNGNDLTVAIDSDGNTLDPHDYQANVEDIMAKTMYETLFKFNKEGKLEPFLASGFEVSSDGLVYTISLKDGIKFHDGAPFDAEAVKANLDRIANPDNHMAGYSMMSMIKETKVIDSHKLEVTIDKPFSGFLNNVATFGIASPKALENPKELAQHPVGTGQYILKEWVRNDHLTVEKNPEYWQSGQPKIDQITFKPVPENGARIAMLKAGEADYIYPVPAEMAKSVDGQNGIELVKEPSVYVEYLSMNNTKKPFDNVKVRQAINYAIDKKAFVEVVKGGYGIISESVISPQMEFYSKQEQYQYNPEKAKELLKEAGYKDGFETVLWSKNTSERIKAMEFIQQQLAQVGIKVKVQPMEPGVLTDKINTDPNIDLYFGGWSTGTGNPLMAIQPLLSGEQFPPTGWNTAYYKNDQVTQLIKDGHVTIDLKERESQLKEIQSLIWKDAPWAFMDVQVSVGAKKSYVKGVEITSDSSLNFHNAEIAK